MSDTTSWIQQLVEVVEQALEARSDRPKATYRVQFHEAQFTFRDAANVVPYLNELGVSHLYASPYLKARPGSPHGYDVVDHTRFNARLGTAEDFAGLVNALHEHEMGQILDFVPNHMGVATGENAWWNDVLENGPSSPYAGYFDIDWQPVKTELKNKILLPVLGEQYGQVLEAGQLQLEYDDGAFFLRCYETRLPIDPHTYTVLLRHRLEELKETFVPDAEDLIELESIITSLEYLPGRTETAPDRVAERQREKEVIKGRLRRLSAGSPIVADFIQQNVREFNGDPADPKSYDRLDELLNGQVYRLSHWKAASDEINYRRFFDINDLAALCMEEPQVFEDTHRLVFDLLVSGRLHGLRIDHIDGLYDPAEYLWRLQWGYLRALGRTAYESLCSNEPGRAAPEMTTHEAAALLTSSGESPERHASALAVAERGDEASNGERPTWEEIEPHFLHAFWRKLAGPSPARIFPHLPAEMFERAEPGGAGFHAARADQPSTSGRLEAYPTNVPETDRLPLYVVVEKILELDEQLPPQWPVAGTTGYDFLNLVNGLFVDPTGFSELVKHYGRFVDESAEVMDFNSVAYRSKLLILRVAMSSELQMLAYRLNRLSERHRRTRDFTLNNLRVALREILACFPVYRSYIGPDQISERDRHFIHRAVAVAKRRNPAMDPAVFDFIRDTLLLEQPPGLDEKGQRERQFFVGRFQQVTSPVMAKGVEDTAFYRYFPLASLNEVGGAPARGITTVEEFHRENRSRLVHRPWSLTCTTSHDTKRTEDVRARINVLSEVPQLWRRAISRWARLNRRHRREVDGQPAPSRNDEYLFYQSLVGVWPLEGLGSADFNPRGDSAPHKQTSRQLIERLQGYMEKATHEAKEYTSWINPNLEYDTAVRDFVAAVLDDNPKNRFLPEFREFHERIVDWGLYTALSQAFLKLISPGAPDIYQGQELWDFSLVDPDNRRPVDFSRRRQLLAELRSRSEGMDEVGRMKDDARAIHPSSFILHPSDNAALLELARDLAQAPRDPRIKLFVTWKTLEYRRRHAEMFCNGQYLPLEAEGSHSHHVCAFAWRWKPGPDASAQGRHQAEGDEVAAVAVAPRLLVQLTPPPENSQQTPPPLGESIWHETRLLLGDLAETPLRNIFTGQTHRPENGTLRLASVLGDFPVALLTTTAINS